MKKRGIYSIMVDEWDKFELEKQRYDIQKIKENEYEGEMIMSERRVLVRLSKAYNVVEVEVTDVLPVDFEEESQWAKNECINLLNQLPDEGFGKGTPTKQYTPKSYTKEKAPYKPHQAQAPSSKVSRNDITLTSKDQDPQNGFGSEKQFGFLVQGINKGIFTLQQVNSCRNYGDVGDLTKEFFAKNKR